MKKLLLLFCFLFFTRVSFATHNMAGRISYQHITGNTYEIKVETYTNCNGTTTDRCELIFYFGDGDSAVVPRSNGPLSSSCSPATDGVIISSCLGTCTKYNVYQTTHTYAGPGNYLITMTDPNRAAGISNIVNSVNTPFHLEAELVINAFLSPNNSAYYLNTDLVQCPCVGVTFNYNPGFYDADGDSLYYENPLSGSTGYTDPASTTSFTINSSTGDVIWNSPSSIGIYVYDIKVSEWQLVGGTRFLVGSSMMEIWNSVGACTGINENDSNPVSVNVFPNPSSGTITFSIVDEMMDLSYNLQIFNSLGQAVKTIEMDGSVKKIKLEGLNSGIYFYTLTGDKKQLKSGKFIISDAK